MSQEQPLRPRPGDQDRPLQDEQQSQPQSHQPGSREITREPVRYGDVFNVSGDLSTKPIAPEDANMMQSAETRVFGRTQKGGPAAIMQSAATHNERIGLVGHGEVTDIAGDQGVSVAETDIPGARIITEKVAEQVVGQFVEPTPLNTTAVMMGVAQSAITIGEALEASAQSAGNKAVDHSDAAAIQAAEVRATGSNMMVPGGLAATAQSAASHNAARTHDNEKIKLSTVLEGATAKLTADKVVTRADAEGVMSAELRNNPNLSTHPGGIAASMLAAARLNENINP